MSIDTETLAALFDPSRDAVFGVRNGELIYRNPAAAEKFPDFSAAHLAMFAPPENGTSTAIYQGAPLDITVANLGDVRVYTFSFRVETASVSAVLPTMEGALTDLRRSLDELTEYCRVERFAPYDIAAAGAYRGYFRVLRLYKHLQLLQQLEAGYADYNPIRLPMNLLCGSICHTLNSLLGIDGIHFDYITDMKGECIAAADEKLTELLILNLLTDSLLRLPEEGGHIRVTLAHQDRRIVLGIDDKVPGTPSGTNASTTGDDLGLRLVRAAAERQGGALLIDSVEGGGTRTRVLLPAADTQSLHELSKEELSYPRGGMDTLLTELSPYLDLSFYRQRYLD
ncbi:MAG: ATP-binding protein [Oscillospiraceae bacterium]